MPLRAPHFLFCALLSLMGCDCGQEEAAEPTEAARHGLTAEQASEVLVTVGDKPITLGEFADELAAQPPNLRARFSTPERRREFLDSMVRFELLAQEAERRGLDEDPEVLRTRDQLLIQHMMRDLFEAEMNPDSIDEEAVTAYYEAHIDEFRMPAQRRGSVIVTSSEAEAARLLASFADLENTEEGAFVEAALAQADEARAARRGDIGFVSNDGTQQGEAYVPEAVGAALFELESLGDVAPEVIAVDTADGETEYWIVRLTGRREALERSVDDAERSIRQRLWAAERDAAIEELTTRLREASDVEINQDALGHVRVEVESARNEEAALEQAPTENEAAPDENEASQ